MYAKRDKEQKNTYLRGMKLFRNPQAFDCWLIVVAVLYGLVFALTPWGIDDFNYAYGTVDCTSPVDVAAGVWRNAADRWFYDTGRLANIVSPVFLGLLPHWIFAILSGIAMWVTFFFGIRLAGVRQGSVWAYFIVFVLTFALPWLDFAFTVIFALNYVWTGALTVVVLRFLFCRQPRGRGATVGVCLLALAAGWMHEGFSVPVIAGLFAWWLARGRRMTSVQWAMAGSYFLGFLFIVASPAVWRRAGVSVSLFEKFTWMEIIPHAVAFNIVPFAFLLLLAVVVCRRRLREHVFGDARRREFVVFTFTATLTAMAIFFSMYLGPRMGWTGTLMATLGGAAVFSALDRMPCGLRRALSLIMAVCVAANLVGTAVLQYDYMKENDEITRLFNESPTGEVYYDNLPMKLDISCFKTSGRCFNEHYPQEAFATYYHNGDGKMLQLLPSVLRGFEGKKAIACASDSTLYLYRGLLLSSEEPAEDSVIRITTDRFGTVDSRLRARPFTASDGYRWYLIIPHVAQMYPFRILDAAR